MILTADNQRVNNVQRSVKSTFNMICKALEGVKMPVEWLRKYYSKVCEKELTLGQTVLLINTQFAFLFTALPANMSIIARIAGCAWLIFSLKKCHEQI